MLAAPPVLARDGSVVAAGARPYQGAAARRVALPVVRREAGAAVDAKAFQGSAMQLAPLVLVRPAQYGRLAERAVLLMQAAVAAKEPVWVAAAAAVPTKFGRAEVSELVARERDYCATEDAAAQRYRTIAAASTAQACCEPVLRSLERE